VLALLAALLGGMQLARRKLWRTLLPGVVVVLAPGDVYLHLSVRAVELVMRVILLD
jgi:hypothetical protein